MTNIKLDNHLLPSQICVPNIDSEILEIGYLKILSTSDVDCSYVNGINNPKVSPWLISSSQKKFSKDSIISYVEANNNDPSSLLFGFYLNGQLRGTARLHDANSEYVNIGIAVFDVSIWGKSWAPSIITSLCDVTHKYFNIATFKAGIDINNTASIKAFSKAGFERASNATIQYKKGTALFLIKNFVDN